MPDVGQLVATLLATIPRQAERDETVSYSSATFFRHNSPMFDESEGPMPANDSLATFEDLVDSLRCTDEQKVDYVRLKLKCKARYWWKATKTLLTE